MNPIITLSKQQVLALQYEMGRSGFQGKIDEFVQVKINDLVTTLVNSMLTNEIRTATDEQLNNVIAIFPNLADKITP